MNEPITIARNLTLAIERCYRCGRYWGCEDRYSEATCPRCAYERIETAEAEQKQAIRSMNALRGVITRLRGKR